MSVEGRTIGPSKPNRDSSLVPAAEPAETRLPGRPAGLLAAAGVPLAVAAEPATKSCRHSLHLTVLPASCSGSWYCFRQWGQLAANGMVQIRKAKTNDEGEASTVALAHFSLACHKMNRRRARDNRQIRHRA